MTTYTLAPPPSAAATEAARITAAARSKPGIEEQTPDTTKAFGDPIQAGKTYKPSAFDREPAAADGNCFYASFGAGLNGTSTSDKGITSAMRKELLLYIDNNQDKLMDFAAKKGVSLADIRHLVDTEGQWSGPAGDLVPPLMAQATGVEILVFKGDKQKDEYTLVGILPPHVSDTPGEDRTRKGEPPICLVKSNMGASNNIAHYDLLRPSDSLVARKAENLSNRDTDPNLIHNDILQGLWGYRQGTQKPNKTTNKTTEGSKFDPKDTIDSSTETATDSKAKPNNSNASAAKGETNTHPTVDSNEDTNDGSVFTDRSSVSIGSSTETVSTARSSLRYNGKLQLNSAASVGSVADSSAGGKPDLRINAPLDSPISKKFNPNTYDSISTIARNADTDAGSRFDTPRPSLSTYSSQQSDRSTHRSIDNATRDNAKINTPASSQSAAAYFASSADSTSDNQHSISSLEPTPGENNLSTSEEKAAEVETQAKPISPSTVVQDDKYLTQNPSIDCLQKAGIDTENFTYDFLTSEGLQEALRKNNYLETQGALSDGDKKSIKNIVSELNVKHAQNLPLNQNIDLQDTKKATEILYKLSDKLAGMIPMNLCSTLSSSLEDISTSESKNVTITVLTDIIKELKKDKKNDNAQLMADTLNIMVDELSVSIIKDSKEQLKKEIKAKLTNLNKPGGRTYTRGLVSVSIPASPAVSITLGFDHLKSYKTEDYLTILEHRQNRASLSANVGLPKHFGISLGTRVSINDIRAHRDLDQLVDDQADRLLSMIMRTPRQSLQSAKSIYQLNDVVKKQNNLQNKHDRLETNLKSLGIIENEEQLKSQPGHRKKCLKQEGATQQTAILEQ